MLAGKSTSSTTSSGGGVVAVAALGTGPLEAAAVAVGRGGADAAAVVEVVEDGTHLRGYTSSMRYRFTMPCLDTGVDLRTAAAAVLADEREKMYPPVQTAAKTAA